MKSLDSFKNEYFLEVLYEKAKRLFPNEEPETILDFRVPAVLDQLMLSMDENDYNVNIIILYFFFVKFKT